MIEFNLDSCIYYGNFAFCNLTEVFAYVENSFDCYKLIIEVSKNSLTCRTNSLNFDGNLEWIVENGFSFVYDGKSVRAYHNKKEIRLSYYAYNDDSIMMLIFEDLRGLVYPMTMEGCSGVSNTLLYHTGDKDLYFRVCFCGITKTMRAKAYQRTHCNKLVCMHTAPAMIMKGFIQFTFFEKFNIQIKVDQIDVIIIK